MEEETRATLLMSSGTEEAVFDDDPVAPFE